MTSPAQSTAVLRAALPIACVDMFAQLAGHFDSWSDTRWLRHRV